MIAGLLGAALLAPALALAADAAPGGARGAESATEAAPQPAALVAPPERLGYAFGEPRILIRQRLFGLAHGLSLLAAACLDLPAHAGPVQDVYAVWHERQAAAIETLVRDLALHYFGPRAEEAQWPDLARALNLGDSIQPALGEVGLPEACASLPQAIARPRYALDRQLAEADAPQAAASAVASPRSEIPGTQSAPAPTPEQVPQ